MDFVMILSLVAALLSFVGLVIITINAFDDGVLTGLLTFFCFPYTWYYALSQYSGEKKGLVLGMYFGGLIVNVVCRVILAGHGIDA